jgi:hypothetical protein
VTIYCREFKPQFDEFDDSNLEGLEYKWLNSTKERINFFNNRNCELFD